jgi:hypothetical protein
VELKQKLEKIFGQDKRRGNVIEKPHKRISRTNHHGLTDLECEPISDGVWIVRLAQRWLLRLLAAHWSQLAAQKGPSPEEPTRQRNQRISSR